MAIFSCACCGSDVTAPYFHKGFVYGYTCIKKVNPAAKKVKDAGPWISVDSVTVELVEGFNKVRAVAEIGGFKFSEIAHGDLDANGLKFIMPNAKMMKVAEFKNGSNCLHKNFDITQKRDQNGCAVAPLEFLHHKTQKILVTF